MTPPELILVIEDDAELGELVRGVLQEAGYTVVIARDGREALTVLETLEPPPAVILTDLLMPGLSGWDFVALLRQRRQFSMIPVVLITGTETPLSDRMRAAFDRCVQKPVVPAKLLALVAEFTLRAGAARVALKR